MQNISIFPHRSNSQILLGIDYTTTCDCVDTKCKPQGTSEDACTAICGNTSCPWTKHNWSIEWM